jgi:hypothetical protein
MSAEANLKTNLRYLDRLQGHEHYEVLIEAVGGKVVVTIGDELPHEWTAYAHAATFATAIDRAVREMKEFIGEGF